MTAEQFKLYLAKMAEVKSSKQLLARMAELEKKKKNTPQGEAARYELDEQKPIAVLGQAWSSREHGGLVFERNLGQSIKVRIRERRAASVGPPGD